MPRLVLLDLNLPKLNGLEVLARLRSDPRTKNLTIVVMTSSREERDVASAYALGANSYVVKPLEYGRFAEFAREIGAYWLDHNQPAVLR
jgi:two-component system response regulator